MIKAPERPDAIASRATEDKLATLHDQLYHPLIGYVTKLTLGDRRAAEDIVQETLLRAWRYLGQHPETELEGFRPWLYMVARRLVIDMVRALKARPTEVMVEDLTRVSASFDNIGAYLRAESVREALLELQLEHRAVLIELYYHGLSVVEAAAKLGVPAGTVKSRSFYAKQALRALLER
jgi:RNA polymerase sigma-70 factor, ECF subfamily